MNTALPAIDVHGHYGRYQHADAPPQLCELLSADAAEVARRAQQAGIAITIVSPLDGLFPRGRADAVAANLAAAKQIRDTPGLLQWVIAHPAQPETFGQVEKLLAEPWCVGIKIHPEEHAYAIRQEGSRLFELAARHNAIVLAHSGDPNSRPADFVPLANQHPNVQLILAHLGNGGSAGGDPTLQVRAAQASRHGNIWIDTSSARSLLPGLVEWAVGELGGERLLFGTDTPLYSVAMQRARIDHAEISAADKQQILQGNAHRLFGSTLPTRARESLAEPPTMKN